MIKERRKRQLAERRIQAVEKNSRQLVQHYDARLIELAKEVSMCDGSGECTCVEVGEKGHVILSTSV